MNKDKDFNYHRQVLSYKEKSLCILYSGGLDSLIAYHYAKYLGHWDKITCLHVQMGQPYARKELDSVKKAMETNKDIQILEVPIISNPMYNYSPATVEEQIVPGRNLTLATIGANFGTTIWINALLGELVPHVPDKNHTFFNMASSVLSHSYGEDFIVESPFWYMTKSDTVALGLLLGLTHEELKATSSCYDDTLHNCGICGTCFKRSVAMRLNGISEEYNQEPFLSDYAKSIRNKLINKSIQEPRLKADYFTALTSTYPEIKIY